MLETGRIVIFTGDFAQGVEDADRRIALPHCPPKRHHTGGAVMAQGNEVKWISQDAQVVKDLALRSGKILLALLEEMRLIKSNYPVAQFLYDEGAQFIRDVLDGTHPVPSNVVIRHRYSDDWEAMEPYPLLDEALNVFSLSVNTAQPEDWPVYVAKLENDFAKRETGAGRVKTVP